MNCIGTVLKVFKYKCMVLTGHKKSLKMKMSGFLLEKSLNFYQQSLNFVYKSLNTWHYKIKQVIYWHGYIRPASGEKQWKSEKVDFDDTVVKWLLCEVPNGKSTPSMGSRVFCILCFCLPSALCSEKEFLNIAELSLKIPWIVLGKNVWLLNELCMDDNRIYPRKQLRRAKLYLQIKKKRKQK